MNPKSVWELLKRTVSEWLEVKAPRLGAALAYYTLFSIAPLLIVIVAIAGLAYGKQAAEGQIVHEISGLVGRQSAQAIQSMIAKFNHPTHGIIATVIGVITTLFGAVGVFSQLQDALNAIWQVVPKPGRGIWGAVREYIASFAMIVVIGFLLLVSLVISAALSALGEFMGDRLPMPEGTLHLVSNLVSFAVTTILFGLIFKILPDVKIRWRDVWVGAAVTALLFTLGKFLIGLYLGKTTIVSIYGTAGSIVVFMVWVYYSSQILLFGAEFTQVYATRSGRRAIPSENAISLVDKIRAQISSKGSRGDHGQHPGTPTSLPG